MQNPDDCVPKAETPIPCAPICWFSRKIQPFAVLGTAEYIYGRTDIMAKRLQGLIAGIVVGALLTGGTALAATTQRLDAVFNSIKLFVDGKEVVPRDATGKTVEPFLVNGTTYLPVRAVAEALGKQVSWDGATYTVYIGDMGGTLDQPTLRLVDAVNIGYRWNEATTSETIDNYGNRYERAIHPYSSNPPNAFETLLDMKYSKFKGTIYVPQGRTLAAAAYVTVKADGIELFRSPPITSASRPIEFDVDVRGYNDLTIAYTYDRIGIFDSYFAPYLGDAGFYQ
jgi:hypothetical protein